MAAQRYDGGGARRTPAARDGGGRWIAGFRRNEARCRCAQKIISQTIMFLPISKLIIITRTLNNYLVTINSSNKLGTKSHVGTRPFTVIWALVAVFHGSSRFD